MKAPALIALALPVQRAGCASGPSAEEKAAMAAEARQTGGTLIQTLGGELKAAIGEKGPDGAISICKQPAPQLVADMSKRFNFESTRVSPKNRNPAGAAAAREVQAQAQAGLEKRMAAGEKPETLDTWQAVSTAKGKQFRYAKALPVQQLCLACRGYPATLSDGAKARLVAEYPLDKATGYAPGRVRGTISIKRDLSRRKS